MFFLQCEHLFTPSNFTLAARLFATSEGMLYSLYGGFFRTDVPSSHYSLPGARVANVIAIPVEALRKFKREPSGRPRQNTPLWRISSGDNAQFMTLILVRERTGQHDALMRRLETIRKKKEHIFPGTVMRYLAESDALPGQVILVLVWRGTVMPDETVREEALKGLRQALIEMLDWNTAEYISGQVLMHT